MLATQIKQPDYGTALSNIAGIRQTQANTALLGVQAKSAQLDLSGRQYMQQLISQGMDPVAASKAVAGIFPQVYNQTLSTYVTADQNARAEADFHAEWMGRAADAYDAAEKQDYPNGVPPDAPPDVKAWNAALDSVPDYIKKDPSFTLKPNQPDMKTLGAARAAAQAVKDAQATVNVDGAAVPAINVQPPVGQAPNLAATPVGSVSPTGGSAPAAPANALGAAAVPGSPTAPPPTAAPNPLAAAAGPPTAPNALAPPIPQLRPGDTAAPPAAPTSPAVTPQAATPAVSTPFTAGSFAGKVSPTQIDSMTQAYQANLIRAGVDPQTAATRTATYRAEIDRVTGGSGSAASTTAAPDLAAPASAAPSPAFTKAATTTSPFELPSAFDFGQEGKSAAAADSGSTPGTRINQILTPNQAASRDKYIAANTDALDTYRKSLTDAASMQSKLTQMDSDIKTSAAAGGWFTPGAGYGERLAVANGVQTVLQSFGGSLPSDMQTAIASGIQSGKLATNLGFDTARALGPREAVMVVNQAMSVQPNLNVPELAGRRLVASIDLNRQYQNDMAQYAGAYYGANPGAAPGTAEAAFVKAHPSTDYAMRAVLQSAPQPGQNPGPGEVKVDPATAVSTLVSRPETVSVFDNYYGAGVGEWVLGHKDLAASVVKAQY